MLYLYFRVSGALWPGFSGAARFSLFRRAHVKAKGTLDSVEQKNYAVGEQKVGQPRKPTSAFFPAHPPFSFEGEGKEGMQRGKINGRVPFGTWSSEMLRTVGRVPHTGGKRNSGCYS